jgi:hypothetical protein
MGVISVTSYQDIVANYSNALTQLVGLSTNYYNAAYIVLEYNDFDVENDLLTTYYNAYSTASVAFNAQPQSVVNAVRALQNHVLSKGLNNDVPPVKFSSINEFYADNAGTFTAYFTEEFAALSQQAGHTIEDTYIA